MHPNPNPNPILLGWWKREKICTPSFHLVKSIVKVKCEDRSSL